MRSKSLFWKLPWSMSVNLPPIFFQSPQSCIEARGQGVTQKTWFSNFWLFLPNIMTLVTKVNLYVIDPIWTPHMGSKGVKISKKGQYYIFFWLIALKSYWVEKSGNLCTFIWLKALIKWNWQFELPKAYYSRFALNWFIAKL